MIRAGQLRSRIAFLVEGSTQDAEGQSKPTWRGLAGSTNVEAEALQIEGGEIFRGQQVEAQNVNSFLIRYRAGLDPTMRIKWEDRAATYRLYQIARIVDPTGHKRELVIRAVHIDPTNVGPWIPGP